jgi:lysozyme
LDDVGISRSEAYAMLQNDIIKVRSELMVKIPFFKSLTDGRQNALLNMAFNMGTSGLLKFTTTLKLMSEKNYEQASIEVLKSKWASQVGTRANRISLQIKNGF